MEREKLEEAVELTVVVYRLTEKIPTGEILKRKIREVSLALLENFIFKRQDDIIEKIKLLGALFILAQNQNWVSGRGCLAVFERYKNLIKVIDDKSGKSVAVEKNKDHVKKTEKEKEAGDGPSKTEMRSLKRQEIVLAVLKESSAGLGFGDLAGILKNKGVGTTPRTIRNELKKMTEQGMIKQNGWAKRSVYKLS